VKARSKERAFAFGQEFGHVRGLDWGTQMGELTTAGAAAAPPIGRPRGFRLSPEHKSLKGQAAFLHLTLGVYIVMHAASIAMNVWAVSLLQKLEAGGAGNELSLFDDLTQVESMANTLMYTSFGVIALCALAYSMFVYAAARNIERSNAPGLSNGAGMVVGWTFIPIANLFKPFQAMGEIWATSFDPVRGLAAKPAFLLLWWLPWIIGNIVSNVSQRFVEGAEEVGQVITLLWVDTTASTIAIVAACVLAFIVARVVAAQSAWPSIPPPPPPAPVDPNAPLF